MARKRDSFNVTDRGAALSETLSQSCAGDADGDEDVAAWMKEEEYKQLVEVLGRTIRAHAHPDYDDILRTHPRFVWRGMETSSSFERTFFSYSSSPFPPPAALPQRVPRLRPKHFHAGGDAVPEDEGGGLQARPAGGLQATAAAATCSAPPARRLLISPSRRSHSNAWQLGSNCPSSPR